MSMFGARFSLIVGRARGLVRVGLNFPLDSNRTNLDEHVAVVHGPKTEKYGTQKLKLLNLPVKLTKTNYLLTFGRNNRNNKGFNFSAAFIDTT